MSVEEAKKRALAIVREKGLDVALITAYLETRHYPSWSQRDDFGKYNIGLSGISGGPMPVTVGFTRGNGHAVTAELDGTVFTLRGVWYLPTSFDSSDAATVYEGVEMLLDDDVVLAGVYLARDHEACIPAQFRWSVSRLTTRVRLPSNCWQKKFQIWSRRTKRSKLQSGRPRKRKSTAASSHSTRAGVIEHT